MSTEQIARSVERLYRAIITNDAGADDRFGILSVDGYDSGAAARFFQDG